MGRPGLVPTQAECLDCGLVWGARWSALSPQPWHACPRCGSHRLRDQWEGVPAEERRLRHERGRIAKPYAKQVPEDDSGQGSLL